MRGKSMCFPRQWQRISQTTIGNDRVGKAARMDRVFVAVVVLFIIFRLCSIPSFSLSLVRLEWTDQRNSTNLIHFNFQDRFSFVLGEYHPRRFSHQSQKEAGVSFFYNDETVYFLDQWFGPISMSINHAEWVVRPSLTHSLGRLVQAKSLYFSATCALLLFLKTTCSIMVLPKWLWTPLN